MYLISHSKQVKACIVGLFKVKPYIYFILLVVKEFILF